MKNITVYGLANCDMTKKALKWFKEKAILVSFHDIRNEGIGQDVIIEWIEKKGLDTVMNKRSTTWRNLSESEQAKASSLSGALSLLTAHNTLLKRPVITSGNCLIIGFDEKIINENFKSTIKNK